MAHRLAAGSAEGKGYFSPPSQPGPPQRNSRADSAIWQALAETHRAYSRALNARLTAAGNRRELTDHLLRAIYNTALATREASQQATATAWMAP